VGDTKAGRPGTGYRQRAVGTRDKIISHLALVDDLVDETGMASTRLAEAVGYPGSSVAFAQLLSGMERDGLIAREVRGKRTYRISLTEQGAQRLLAAAPDETAVAGRGSGTAATRAGRAGSRTGAARTGSGARGRTATTGRGGTARSVGGRRSESVPTGPLPGSGDFSSAAEFDYDELARRLLIQVVRRLSASSDDLNSSSVTGDPFSLEETVAGLERELATAWTRHGTLTAENMKLRQQLREAQRDLDVERRARRRPVADELDRAEAVLLDRLLSPADEPGASAG
jgi:hypothetical protein